MRKINLKDYTARAKVQDNANPLEQIEIEIPYHVKDSVINLLFTPGLQLSSSDLVRTNMLAMKIESCKEDEILLEDEEYERVKKAFDTYRGFRREAVELVRRITEAEVVEVEQK